MDVSKGAHLRSSPSPGLVPKFQIRHRETGRGIGQKICSKVVRFVSLDTGQEEVGLMSRWDLGSIQVPLAPWDGSELEPGNQKFTQ